MDNKTIQIDVSAPGAAVVPYWNRMICADRAALSLRADVREHIALATKECGFRGLRQHGIFHDDMYIWPDPGQPMNFQYLYSNYDYYLSLGLKPMVELSFLPRWLASNDKTCFTHCKCPACPPKDWAEWHKLVRETARALVSRYGLAEVQSWNFEVWNEPNIPFWSGTQAEYFELYRQAAEAVKSVDASLRIGGPATANFTPGPGGEYQPCWMADFMEFCDREHLPVDFVSTHPYPTDFPFDDQTKTCKRVVRDRDATYHDLSLLRRMVDHSPFKNAAIHCDEWGSSPGNPDRTHDHVFSATFHLENLLRSVGLVDSLARWDLSDVAEEGVPGREEFHGGWGIVTVHGLKKPAFHAYRFLNQCGGTVLRNDWTEGLAVFRSHTGSYQILLYNHHPYANTEASWHTAEGIEAMIGPGTSRAFEIELKGLPRRVRVRRSLVDREHGWAERAWRAMGSPTWPDAAQLDQLRHAQEPATTSQTLLPENGRLLLSETLSDLGMMLIEIEET
jgi:xylan 1,4-beta-xylosidase